MKKIALLLPAIFLMPVINAQWTDSGNNITTSDNVGIGTTNPQHKMEVYGTNNAIGIGLTNYGWANTHLIGAEYGAWDNSRTNAAGTYFYRWTGTGTSYHLGYIGQEINDGHWGLAFKTDSENSKTHATSTRMFINTDGNIGIGTTSPNSPLSIGYNNGAAQLALERASGGETFLLNINSSNHVVFTNKSGGGDYDFKTNIGGQAISSALFIEGSNGNIGIGTTSPDAKLAVNGDIHTQEVRVDMTGWPDYVFKKEYTLPTLEEVEVHIEEKGHLQDIPSAKEVEHNGVKLGEMNSKLLQKIEELMLYTIQQQKEIKELKSRLEKLESK